MSLSEVGVLILIVEEGLNVNNTVYTVSGDNRREFLTVSLDELNRDVVSLGPLLATELDVCTAIIYSNHLVRTEDGCEIVETTTSAAASL